MASARVALLLVGTLIAPGLSSHVFLGRGDPQGPAVSADELRASLERVFRESLSRGAGGGALEATERALAPMYATLPKNPDGHLAHATVRYALHRYFAQRHGWLIKGLGPDGGSWNSSNSSLPTFVAQDRVPSLVQELIERRLGGHGLSLKELAVFASMLEKVVHQDTLGWLEAAYRITGAPLTGRATAEQVTEATDTMMMMFVLGLDLPSMNRTEVSAERDSILEWYPTWGETKIWLDDVRRSFAYTQRDRQNPFVDGALSFEAVGQLMEDVRDGYGRWQTSECGAMKNKLLALEDTRGTGRVSLAKFYSAPADDGMSRESVAYLRQLGALDESDPSRLRVIIPNYIVGPNNCAAASGLHTVCCINECEALLAEVEREIAAPMATPAEIIKVVSQIPSGTVDAPRNLTAVMLGRLEEVASHHGGKVPLHGRLFGQWMHVAFPNECPYPHVSGSTAPRVAEEWMEDSAGEAEATEEEMAQYIEAEAGAPRHREAEEELFLWSDEEELLAVHHHGRTGTALDISGIGRCIVCVLLLASFLASTVISARSGWSVLKEAQHGGGKPVFGSFSAPLSGSKSCKFVV